MKKQITSLLLLTTLVAGCSDNFLSPKPQSSITTGNFYETPDEINQAVNGVYAGMHNWASNIYIMMSEVRSPNYMGVSHNAQRDWWDIATFTMKPQDDILESVWGDLYQMINRSNMVLANVDGVDFGPASQRVVQSGFAVAVLLEPRGNVDLQIGESLRFLQDSFGDQ